MENAEPTVIVNGQRLSEGETMTLRVALNMLIIDMGKPDALGVDRLGKTMATQYERLAYSILTKLHENKNSLNVWHL